MPTDDTTTKRSATTGPVHWSNHALSCAIACMAAVHLSFFWIVPRSSMPKWLNQTTVRFRVSFIDYASKALDATVGWTPDGRWRWAMLSAVMALVLPWVVMAVIGRGRPRDLGIRRPNRIGWRLLIFGYLASFPLLAAMASSPTLQAYYRREIDAYSVAGLFGPYMVVLIAEHFLFHGVYLAVLRPGRRWPIVPEPAPTEGTRLGKVLRRLGLAQPTGDARGVLRVMRWIGLPDACLTAVLLQTVLFGLIHLGKAPAEVAMSFPGGLAMAYVAYRCNSWLVPMLLHAATGTTVLVLVWLWPK